MAFERICAREDVGEGEVAAFKTCDGRSVLVAGLPGGVIKAYQGMCPHQHFALVEGDFDGEVLTCPAHLWEFDLISGKGVNPPGCHLAQYPVEIEGDDVCVDVAGIIAVKG